MTIGRDFWADPRDQPPILLLGYTRMSEPAIRTGVRELAEAVTAGS